jgi:hypothetical protein
MTALDNTWPDCEAELSPLDGEMARRILQLIAEVEMATAIALGRQAGQGGETPVDHRP